MIFVSLMVLIPLLKVVAAVCERISGELPLLHALGKPGYHSAFDTHSEREVSFFCVLLSFNPLA